MMLYAAEGMQDIDIAARLDCSPDSIARRRARFGGERLDGLEDQARSGRPRRYEDAIKPWQTRSWIFARDPDFAEQPARALDLYARTFEGKRLRPGRVRDQR
jgi:hypothetical protein